MDKHTVHVHLQYLVLYRMTIAQMSFIIIREMILLLLKQKNAIQIYHQAVIKDDHLMSLILMSQHIRLT